MWAAVGDGRGLKTLWTDAPDAMERVESLRRSRRIHAAERDDLAHFVEHGWLVWRNAIEPELVDALVKDIRSHHEHPGMFVTTNHRGGTSKLQLSGSAPETFESLFDLYVNLASARDVCLHPRIARFLTLIFNAQPVAFQQLLFQRSNGHRVHQDTSVVAVEDPLLLAATWIALEDVVEGSGELAFYDRSHRLPHYLFKDGSKRIDFQNDDADLYPQELDKACKAAGMAYERFMAKKGDVFFWTADLVHRSHPRTLPEGTSRLSCVTHYHPATTAPFWFRYYPDNKGVMAIGDRGSIISAHYKLPKTIDAMIAPNSRLGS